VPTFAVADTLTLTDSLKLISPEAAFGLEVDVLYLQDTLAAPTLGLNVLVADTLAFTDALQTAFKFELRFTDRILLIDDAQAVQESGRIEIAVADILNLTDSKSTSNTNATAATDTLVLSDLVGLMYGQVSADTLNLSDAAATALSSIFTNLTVSATDTLTLADAIQLVLSKQGVSVSDSLLLSDAVFVALHSNFNPYLRRYLNDVR